MLMLNGLIRISIGKAKGHKTGISKLLNKLSFVLGSGDPLLGKLQ
jgi:hypothetical protein